MSKTETHLLAAAAGIAKGPDGAAAAHRNLVRAWEAGLNDSQMARFADLSQRLDRIEQSPGETEMTDQTTTTVPDLLADVGQRLQAKPTRDELHDAIAAGDAAGLTPGEIMRALGLDPSNAGNRTQYRRWRTQASNA